jgi:hypothetical protein
MTAMELIPDDEGVLAFDNAIDLEMGLRPLRLKLADYVMALFNRALSAAKARGITLGNPKLHTARKSAVEAVKAEAD